LIDKLNQLRDRYRGALLGLAAGDALVTTLEFKPPGTFKPITDMVGGGRSICSPGNGRSTLQRPCALPKAWCGMHGFDPKDQVVSVEEFDRLLGYTKRSEKGWSVRSTPNSTNK
jgi:hypothetical protein